jgi:hypothetical protein
MKMEALVVVLLTILIGLMVFVGYLLLSGNPIRIEHIHRTITEQPKVDPKEVEEFDKQQDAINEFISSINKEMGVLTDEQIKQPEED